MSEPKIRFKGCQGEWERKELGDIASRITRKNVNMESTLPLTISAANGLVSQDSFFNNIVAGSNLQNYYLIKEGEFAYNKSRSSEYPVGAVKRLDKFEKGVLSTLYIIFKLNDGVSSDYVAYFFDTNLWYGEILKRASEGARNHGLLNIGAEDFLDIGILLPPTLPEQRQIAAYFRSLDGILSGCEARLSSLRRLKEGALQAFFPQQGETQPKIRFKGCQGEWVKKELSECLEISDERNLDGRYKRDDVLSVSDDYGVVNQIELLGRSYAGKTLTNYDVLRTGQIVYTKSPLRSKPYGIVKLNTGKPGIVSSLYAVYNAKPNISADYLHWYFDPAWRLNAYIRPLVNKGAKNTMNISDETALTGYIYIPPTLAEQRLIANFFRTLDRRIELERQRLEKLKQLKAACLEKMFV